MIDSFKVDHTKLRPGLYVSRVDKVGDQTVTTYDIRMKRPNIESPMSTTAIHSLEHLGATFLRQFSKTPVLYFGPMGCRTGFYLILVGQPDLVRTLELIKELLRFVLSAEEVSGIKEEECGNAADHSLALAKEEAQTYLSGTLALIRAEDDPRLSYPK